MLNARLTPMDCRLRNLTYAADLRVDIEYTCGNERRQMTDVVIGQIPVMLHSNMCAPPLRLPALTPCGSCNLHDKTPAELARLGECPIDSGL